MKRLLCILSGMNVGGAETFLMKVYRNIDRLQYQMDFCINEKEKCFYEDEILSMGGKVYRIPSKSENLKDFKKQLAEIIKINGYGNVLRITSNAMGFMDLKIAKMAGANVCCARSSNASDGYSLKLKIVHFLGRILFNKYVDIKIAPSDLAAKHTFGNKTYEDGKVNIIHNGVDLEIFKFYPEERVRIRSEFGIDDGTKLVGHIGRFDEQKNHAFLIDIFASMIEKDKDLKLLLVGKGNLQDQIKEKAYKLGLSYKIIFAGFRNDIPYILSAMDVFVFPSFYEGMPNTVIEAQATGLPCIISDTITQEANITGLVEYMSLGNADNWAMEALKVVSSERIDTKELFIKNKYDIQSVTSEFVDKIFDCK